MSPETCRADLKRLINENVVTSCCFFISVKSKFVSKSFKSRTGFEKRRQRGVIHKLSVGFTKVTINLCQPMGAKLAQAQKMVTLPPIHAVAQLAEALRYKPEVRGFDSRWCHWNFSLT